MKKTEDIYLFFVKTIVEIQKDISESDLTPKQRAVLINKLERAEESSEFIRFVQKLVARR